MGIIGFSVRTSIGSEAKPPPEFVQILKDPSMQSSLSRSARPSRAAGVGLLVFGAALISWFAIQFGMGSSDGDNPAVTIEFIRLNPHNYVYAGIALWVMAISFSVAVLAVEEIQGDRTWATRAITAWGLFASAFFLVHGALRVSTPGTLIYIDGLDHAWGLSAYLAVQMVGTQGLGTGGLLALSFWAIGTSAVSVRRRTFPRAISVMGTFPVLLVLAGVAGPLGIAPDAGYFVYVAAFLGLVIWCIACGLVLLLRKQQLADSGHIGRS